jgi:hypothetical protein
MTRRERGARHESFVFAGFESLVTLFLATTRA